MRLDINLATRPYEDAREFWARWGLGVGLLAIFTLPLLGFVDKRLDQCGQRSTHNLATGNTRSQNATSSGRRPKDSSI